MSVLEFRILTKPDPWTTRGNNVVRSGKKSWKLDSILLARKGIDDSGGFSVMRFWTWRGEKGKKVCDCQKKMRTKNSLTHRSRVI